MNPGLLRTIQVGLALLVVTVVTLTVAVILDLMSSDAALEAGLNVAAIIAVAVVAGAILVGVFGIGRDNPGDR